MNNGYTAYRTTQVDTADQGRLILICYDVAIKNCKMAVERFDDVTLIEERTKLLFKAQDAISELMCGLNMSVGEMSRNLYRLYEYYLHRLVTANVKNDVGCVKEVLRHLENLRSAWVEAIANVKKSTMDSPVHLDEQVSFASLALSA